MSQDTRIAVDVAKAVFEIAISDRPGHVIRRERPKRRQFLSLGTNSSAGGCAVTTAARQRPAAKQPKMRPGLGLNTTSRPSNTALSCGAPQPTGPPPLRRQLQ